MITNIDVTLREGGYRNSFNFSLEYALAHARSSVASGFDWVEIGYRKGSSRPELADGLTARSDDEYRAAMAREIGPEHSGIMVHPGNLGAHDVDDAWSAGARRIINAFSGLGVTALSLVDSNGRLLPHEVHALVESSISGQGLALGIHANDHVGLALVNTIQAVDAGVTWVDSAVLGTGKGAGNLVAEQWLAYLSQRPGSGRFDLSSLLELSTRLAESVAEATPRLDVTAVMLDYFDFSVEHGPRLAEILDGHPQVRAAALTLGALLQTTRSDRSRSRGRRQPRACSTLSAGRC